MKPSGKFQGFSSSTPDHDLIQLWVSENQDNILKVFKDKIDFPCEVKLKIEQPVYSGPNKFLIGIVDGWLRVDNRFLIIYEIKPQLNSISQAIGQITTYSDFLGRDRYGCRIERGLLIITLEESTKFDNMLLRQGIRILHISQSELTGGVSLV